MKANRNKPTIMTTSINDNSGSFRDPANRVYELNNDSNHKIIKILRGVNAQTLSNHNKLAHEPFYIKHRDAGRVIKTHLNKSADPFTQEVLKDGWAGCLEHEIVPFISYPYEWSFSMLKDAALLQLQLIETSLENGWTLKDATPYNVQWIGSRPVFIDEPSFEPWEEGDPWVGYRQFCSMFLIPLMFKAHLGIDYLPLIRSQLDGIPPLQAVKYFSGKKLFKSGVLSHVVFPANVENKIAKQERDRAPAKKRGTRKQSKAMVVGLVQSLSRLINNLNLEIEHTDWSHYDKNHSYTDTEHEEKKKFILKHTSNKSLDHVWDIGCNTGTFSKIVSTFSNHVISLDGDHNSVEQLYLAEKNNPASKILPLVMNLANISPGQGWAGKERQALDQRQKPDLVMCLALIHHMRISANIPNIKFLHWLRSLNAEIIIEFVNREDEMAIKLLTNKKEQYDDYNGEQFVIDAENYFNIIDRKHLKSGKREIFFLTPK